MNSTKQGPIHTELKAHSPTPIPSETCRVLHRTLRRGASEHDKTSMVNRLSAAQQKLLSLPPTGGPTLPSRFTTRAHTDYDEPHDHPKFWPRNGLSDSVWNHFSCQLQAQTWKSGKHLPSAKQRFKCATALLMQCGLHHSNRTWISMRIESFDSAHISAPLGTIPPFSITGRSKIFLN
eukprot:1232764-Amphidinium_carterae.1